MSGEAVMAHQNPISCVRQICPSCMRIVHDMAYSVLVSQVFLILFSPQKQAQPV